MGFEVQPRHITIKGCSPTYVDIWGEGEITALASFPWIHYSAQLFLLTLRCIYDSLDA
jgi:hypothetical protein